MNHGQDFTHNNDNTITLTTGMIGHVSQINTQRISLHIYFAQLRHHQENTDISTLLIISTYTDVNSDGANKSMWGKCRSWHENTRKYILVCSDKSY